MARLSISEDWWSSPTESENGRLVIVTGHGKLDNVRATDEYTIKVEVSWLYPALPDGMPQPSVEKLMEEATDALLKEFKTGEVAVCTAIITGDGQRDWVFYTRNLRSFGRVLNRALAPLPQMPLQFSAVDDPNWEEYIEYNGCNNDSEED